MSKAKVVPMTDAELSVSAEHDEVERLLAEVYTSGRAPDIKVEEMEPTDENGTSPTPARVAVGKADARAPHVAVTVKDNATVTPRKNLTAENAPPADKAEPEAETTPTPKKLPIWWAWMGLQYTGAAQMLLQLPICITTLGLIGSIMISYQPVGLLAPVTLNSVSWCTNSLFISVPFLITTLHYAAARHALEVAREITKSSFKAGELALWTDEHVNMAKIEGSRLGITAFSLYVLMPMMATLVFIGAMLSMGSSAADSQIQLIVLALSLIAFILIVIGSVHVMVRGLLRRERENSVNYVTFSLEPTFISLFCFQLFFSCVGILQELTVPTAPGTNILMSVGYFESDKFSYPTMDICHASINATYLDRYCTGQESFELPWQLFGGQLNIECDDGGWGIFKSLFTACRTLVGEKVVKEPVTASLFSQLYVGGLVLIKEHVTSADPTLNLGNCMQKGSRYLRTAIISAIICAVCVPALAAASLHSMTSQGQTATSFSLFFRFVGGGFLVLSMLCIFVHFIVRKFKQPNHKTFFISYKQDDRSDGAVSMLYHHLPGKGHWLDKMVSDRSVQGMINGVANSDVFLAVFSPNYLESWFCCLELHTAMENNKPIMIVFNNHKYVVQDVLDMIEPYPELHLLRNTSEILPIHEEIQVIRPFVERIVENAASRTGLYGPHNKVPEMIAGNSFEEQDTAKLEALKAKVIAEEKKLIDEERARGPRVSKRRSVGVGDEERARIAALEAKLNNLFTRTGAYEFTHKMGR